MELVSIRCCRHKKRFDIPKKWAKTVCDWLCPQCYEKLSALEREKYRPTEKVVLRPPTGANVRLPSPLNGVKESAKQAKEKCPVHTVVENAIDETKKASSKPTPKKEAAIVDTSCPVESTVCETDAEANKPQYEVSKSEVRSPFVDQRLDFLLPRFRIYCHKCKKEMPCHEAWFKQSTTLCPTCYAEASDKEREVFEKTYGDQAKRYVVAKPITPSASQMGIEAKSTTSSTKPKIQPRLATSIEKLQTESCLAKSTIMKMSISEIKKAVKRGSLTLARARIELKRRSRREYYETLPEDIGPAMHVRY